MTHDLAIKGGTIIDGTGGPSRRADIGIADGTIVEIGDRVDGARELDASGALVTPGFIDIHTHYDAQVFWDPWLTPSSLQGVTSVVAGNCGFSLAPCPPDARESILSALVFVEDMDPDTLRMGIDWSWETFPEYLSRVAERGVGINFGSYVGHTAVRLAVVGPEAYDRASTPGEIEAMRIVVRDALSAGALGFSTDRSSFHRAEGGRMVPSVLGSDQEVKALMKITAELDRGICSVIVTEDYDWLYDFQAELGRPVTWCPVITYPEGSPRQPLAELQLAKQRSAFAAGSGVHPQVTCRPVTFQVTMANPMPLFPAPAFGELAGADIASCSSRYRDESWRTRARAELASKRYVDPSWDKFVIDETTAHSQDRGRSVAELAAERGIDPLDMALEIALDDKLQTRFRVTFANDEIAGVSRLLLGDGCVLGLSDAGAHIDQMCDASLPTDFLAYWVRDRELMPIERGVRKLTGELADLVGLADRGYLQEGGAADVCVLDLAELDPGPITRVTDFPAGRSRLVTGDPAGLRHVLVNGTIIRQNGESRIAEVKELPGRLLRG